MICFGSVSIVYTANIFTAKSKKQRRAAAKRKLKHEQAMLASGETEAYAPKIPLQRQTIDLPSNEDGTLTGALEAAEKREEVRKAMRGERRKNIKEANFLKGFK
jgi:large subunit ribosomal protein L54